MTKINQPELRGLPQELIDWVDEITEAVNFGKIQRQVLGATPIHSARRGEFVVFQDSTGGALFYMSSDQATLWTEIARVSF